MLDNFIGIKSAEADLRVYRIMPVQYLYDLFESGENVLVHPKKWSDPFENFILNSPFRLSSGRLVPNPRRESFFGQCWSTKSQSDALWRLYSHTSGTVRVRTTIRRLIDGLTSHVGPRARDCAFIGRVEYLSKAKLLARARSFFPNSVNPTNRRFASTLLFKRSAFAHETEIRLLYFDCEGLATDLYRYPIDPLTVVDDILIDPRLDLGSAEKLASRIRKRVSFSGRIARSDLYELPPDLEIPF